MIAWTPGPWGVNKYGSIGAGAGWHGPIVACVEPFYGVDERWGSHKANACLIAAAPELYEAVEFVLDHIADKDRRPRDLYPAFGLDARRAIDLCFAALAKARGDCP
jgi:hypothetical protein